ncbi:MAG: hypothetical protein ACI8P3_002730 [Saprospiraceae bacterium]|jgi:hypothetical protein
MNENEPSMKYRENEPDTENLAEMASFRREQRLPSLSTAPVSGR